MNRGETKERNWIALFGLPSIIVSLFLISTPTIAAMLAKISDYSIKQWPFIRKDIPIRLADEPNVMPEYEGGYEALYQLLFDNIQFPETLLTESGINKKVVINLSVTELGEINEVKILHSPSKEIESEIRRVIKLTKGKWEPATIEGHPVTSTINLPITFTTM